jgi:pseudouridylate synthase
MAGGLAGFCRLADGVARALREGKPVVALESTLITHGFPHPRNREVAEYCEEEVRAAGAVPATIAVKDGRILIGVEKGELDALASAVAAGKASRATLGAALSRSGWSSTTVSATMIAAHAAGIRVFATGGIGGVHRGALDSSLGGSPSFDISADLTELARTPVVVVCAGPKAILDVRLTIEHLETLGVPVVTLGSDQVPGFYYRDSGVRSPVVAGSLEELAKIVCRHLELGLGCGVLVCVPIPERHEVPRKEIEAAIEAAAKEAYNARVEGSALTPWLLRRIDERTEGKAVIANVELLRNNARTAGLLADALVRPA